MSPGRLPSHWSSASMNSPSGAGNGHGMHRQPHERPGHNSRRASTVRVGVDTRGHAAPLKVPPTLRVSNMDLNALPKSPRGAHAAFPGSNAAAAQGSQAGADASAATKLRYALIVLRLLQVRKDTCVQKPRVCFSPTHPHLSALGLTPLDVSVQLGACAFNGWSAGSDAKMLTDLAKYRGIYLPGVVLSSTL